MEVAAIGTDASGRQGPEARRTSISGLLAGQIVLGLLVAVTTGVLIVHVRQKTLAAAAHEISAMSLILADQAERSFGAVDLVQTTFLELTRADHIVTPDDFRRRMSAPEINQQLIDHSRALQQLDTMALIDSSGIVVNINHEPPVPPTDVTDRAYFQALKGDTAQTRYIGDPIIGRTYERWVVAVARRVTSETGEFLGVIFGGVRLDYFERLYQMVGYSEDTTISLFRTDCTLLVRYPKIEGSIGKVFPQSIVAGMGRTIAATSAADMQISPIDGSLRLVSAHSVAGYPMAVTVSVRVSSVLQSWRRQVVYLVGTATILELVVFGVGLLMQRQLRSQHLLSEARAATAEAEIARRLAEAGRRGAEAELTLGQERERAAREMHVQALRFSAALGNMSEVLCLFDAADRLVVGNDRLAAMLGLLPGTITAGMTVQAMESLLARQQGKRQTDGTRLLGLIQSMQQGGRRTSEALDMDSGQRIAVNFAPMENDGWLVTLEDITEQRQSESRIKHMAHHDALTGLANRVLFHQRLSEAVARGGRGESWAVLYIDLDHFKAVNDTLGHPVGDALLRAVTERLSAYARDSDTIARLGGDEFAIVQSISEPSDSAALARRLIDAIGEPYEIEGSQIIIGASVGIATIPEDGEDVDAILKNADMALYRSKAEGRGRYHFFEPEMNTRMQARRALDLDLRRALAEGELRVFYQPILNIATGSVCGFEALVRWEHPERGIVSPADFIPLAEENGLIVPLGQWVLRQACADAASWPGHLKVAVNLSPVQFNSYTLVEDVAAALADAGLKAARLELEITETTMLADTNAVLVILHQLRNLGPRIALDDFGTGYSSLSYLQRFPFDKVKIDWTFVTVLGQGSSTDAIIASVIDLCGQLGMVTTAEGVETADQLHRLAALHCREAQGNLFSPPRPADEVADMLMEAVPRMPVYDPETV
jgi:diguanylate cyclase (GGDEF)-like protein